MLKGVNLCFKLLNTDMGFLEIFFVGQFRLSEFQDLAEGFMFVKRGNIGKYSLLHNLLGR